jgi:hypothetical protein
VKRTAIKRTAWHPKRKPLRGRSERREAITEERRALVARLLSERPTCEALSHLRSIVNTLGDDDQRIVVTAMRGCTLRSSEVHEVLSRARGGSILDESNCLCLCHTCHAWVTTHPRLATMAGLLKSRWQR